MDGMVIRRNCHIPPISWNSKNFQVHQKYSISACLTSGSWQIKINAFLKLKILIKPSIELPSNHVPFSSSLSASLWGLLLILWFHGCLWTEAELILYYQLLLSPRFCLYFLQSFRFIILSTASITSSTVIIFIHRLSLHFMCFPL